MSSGVRTDAPVATIITPTLCSFGLPFLRWIVIPYLPMYPLTSFTSEEVNTSILGWSFTAAIFSASSRALRDYDNNMALECLRNAQKIWEYEENHDPVLYRSVGTPRNLITERTNAAVELYLSTGEEKYLEAIVAKCEEDDTIRVLVLTGSEKAFIAGADIGDMAKGGIDVAYAMTDQTMRVQGRLADLPKPTIAAISGYALGGGCEVALCCDFRIAADNAVLGLSH